MGRSVTALAGRSLVQTESDIDQASLPTAVGFLFDADQNGLPASFEAHPRTIAFPDILDIEPPWLPEASYDEQVFDFKSPSGDAPCGALDEVSPVWKRTPGGERKCPESRPHRLYAGMGHPAYADLEAEIEPPGSARGEGERGRAGLIFFQDEANYLIVNTWHDDQFQGASVSSFHRVDGKEDVYRAVWTNVGDRIQWGSRYRMRAVFNGLRYLVYCANYNPSTRSRTLGS
jgi:hypothetical protein